MFPPIPENTIRAARASYGKGNVYLRLGDQINTLISNLDPVLLPIRSEGYTGILLAALTLIQHAEGLTDTELTESLHRRADLRYAVHLPTPGPRFDPSLLCVFRQKVLNNQNYRLLFEAMFKVLYPELGTDVFSSEPGIGEVINSICVSTMRAVVVEAMFHAIEALSASHFNWLRQVALPHWYERYSHSLLMLNSGRSVRQKEYTIDDLRIDIQYLLQAIDQSNSEKINEIPEIKTLRQVRSKLLDYRPGDPCAYCFNNSFERRTTFTSTNKSSSQHDMEIGQ